MSWSISFCDQGHWLIVVIHREGLDGIDGLKEKYKGKIDGLKRGASVPGITAATNPSTSTSASTNTPFQPPPPPTPQPETPAAKFTAESKTGVKTLDSYVDVEKFRELPHKEIEYLWRLRHASNPHSLAALVKADVFETILSTARKHPQFILPLPKEEQGAELHFLQWTFPTKNTATVLFTNLAEFKLRGEFAQPHTTVTHHLDLQKEKGLVLAEGSVLPDRGVSIEEGKFLLLCLQKFYGQTAEEAPRKRLLEQFTQGSETFSVQTLLEEAEKIP